MRTMADLVRKGRYADEIMALPHPAAMRERLRGVAGRFQPPI